MSRENQNRDHDGNYLSEEELEKLIAEVETNSMLHAPHNLKDEILQAAEQERSDLSAGKKNNGKALCRISEKQAQSILSVCTRSGSRIGGGDSNAVSDTCQKCGQLDEPESPGSDIFCHVSDQ